MLRRLIIALAYRSLLLAIIVAGIAGLAVAPLRLVRGELTMAGTLREVSAGLTWRGNPKPANPDAFTLNIDVNDEYRAEHPDFAVSIRLEWDDADSDFDLSISKGGKPLEDSSQGQTAFEEVRLDRPANGVYEVITQAKSVETFGGYTSNVRLLPQMPEPSRRAARYLQDPDGTAGPEMFQFAPQKVEAAAPRNAGRTDIQIDAFDQTFIYLNVDPSTGAGQGKPVVDKKGRFLNVFAGGSPNELYFSRCNEPCEKPVARRIFRGSAGLRIDNPYPTIAADRAGGLHVAFSDGHDVLLMSSADGGNSWKDPVVVNDPRNNDASNGAGPWLIAGDSGRVGVTWTVPSRGVYYAFTPDAFTLTPKFSYVLTGTAEKKESLSSGAIDPFGNANILYSSTQLLRQTAGDRLFFGPLVTIVGGLKTDSGLKHVSFSVRRQANGSLTYRDEQRGVSLSDARFTSSKYSNDEITLTGTGTLNDGTLVTFAVLTSNPNAERRELSISMSNGYFAAGPLQLTPAMESKVKTVTREMTQVLK